MQLLTRPALKRIATGLVVLALVILAASRYMCRCGGRAGDPATTMTTSATNLHAHVQMLAGTIGERNLNRPAELRRAAAYIEDLWRAQGYNVARQPFTAERSECWNIEATLPGTPTNGPVVVVGAHYDSVIGCPGANDNGTGVAALLELSRWWAGASQTGSAVRFVAFVNEEPPYFQTDLMGSRVYARACRQRGDDIRAMVSLETMGCYSDAAGSQSYPPIFRWFYPDKGNFIAFVSDLQSRAVMRQGVAAFRGASDFPVECCATFAAISGIGWSDHWAFWQEGYPAFMVTDTAPFRYVHYHEPTDTPDKVDYESLARVTDGLRGVLRALTGSL